MAGWLMLSSEERAFQKRFEKLKKDLEAFEHKSMQDHKVDEFRRQYQVLHKKAQLLNNKVTYWRSKLEEIERKFSFLKGPEQSTSNLVSDDFRKSTQRNGTKEQKHFARENERDSMQNYETTTSPKVPVLYTLSSASNLRPGMMSPEEQKHSASEDNRWIESTHTRLDNFLQEIEIMNRSGVSSQILQNYEDELNKIEKFIKIKGATDPNGCETLYQRYQQCSSRFEDFRNKVETLRQSPGMAISTRISVSSTPHKNPTSRTDLFGNLVQQPDIPLITNGGSSIRHSNKSTARNEVDTYTNSSKIDGHYIEKGTQNFDSSTCRPYSESNSKGYAPLSTTLYVNNETGSRGSNTSTNVSASRNDFSSYESSKHRSPIPVALASTKDANLSSSYNDTDESGSTIIALQGATHLKHDIKRKNSSIPAFQENYVDALPVEETILDIDESESVSQENRFSDEHKQRREPPRSEADHETRPSFDSNEPSLESPSVDEDPQEEDEQPLEIIDMHQYFADDFDINTVTTLPVEERIEAIHNHAKTFEQKVNSFEGTNFSIEFFVLDEKLMRLVENLDKIKSTEDKQITRQKVDVIHYIKDLQSILDKRAK